MIMRRTIASSLAALLFVLQYCEAFQSASGRCSTRSAVNNGVSGTSSESRRAAHPLLASSVLDELEVASSTGTETSSTSELPSILQDIVDERREFEINLGRAMDTLRSDYPSLLYKVPNFSIYHDDINVLDPSGVQLTGLGSYKQSFRFLQSVVGVFYDMDKSVLNHRMVYDWARGSIRISWNAMIVPKVVGNRRNALYVDGVSMYKLDTASGKIIEHKIENVIVNNTPLSPPYPIQGMLTSALLGDRRVGIPAGVGAGAWGAVVEQQ